jgi:tetratricopeptide (TPR) repeat protein
MLIQIATTVGTLFWMWMIFDCVRNEPRNSSWLWLLIILNVPGAIIYFLSKKLPYINLPVPNFFKKWTMKDALWNAEADVKNIGKSHQYVTLANIRFEMSDLDRALENYLQALAKEEFNAYALYGCATIYYKQKQLDRSAFYLVTLLAKDPEYRRGEASLLYGKCLFELSQYPEARSHLERDIKQWGHTESRILLAKIDIYEGDHGAARERLESAIALLRGSPKFNYRRNQHLINQAQKMLKRLSKVQ